MSRSDNSRRGARSRFDDFRSAGRAARDRDEVATATRSIDAALAATVRQVGPCRRCDWITGLDVCPCCGFVRCAVDD